MKHFRLSMAFLAVFALLFASCSKEEAAAPTGESATLSFATMLNDLVSNKAALKQALADIPACSDDTPAFVEVVLSGTEDVGTMEDPLVVSVNPDPGNYDGDSEAEYFTDESSELELEPGSYVLEYFAVWNGDPANAASDLIWIAPHDGGSLAAFVDDALPMSFNLGAGVKKYVDVEVLCFDDRIVNEYGYLFFDIEDTQAIEFCVFGNFCPPSGRHFPAAYTFEVWTSQGGELLDSGTATVALDDNGDYAASPVCVMLPDTEGVDEYYGEITLLSSAAYGQVTETVIRAGVFNDSEVRSFFVGDNNLEYYHFREGCEGDDSPPIFDDPTDDILSYKACLNQINDSGAVAFAYLELDQENNTLSTHVFGFNVEANKVHAQHIHGLDDKNANATCPPDSADENEDGIITLAEGLPFYGGVKVALTDEGGNYPTANAMGMTEYSRTFNLGTGGIISMSDLGPLENRVVVMHGLTSDGEYVGSLPIACAEITKVGDCETCD